MIQTKWRCVALLGILFVLPVLACNADPRRAAATRAAADPGASAPAPAAVASPVPTILLPTPMPTETVSPVTMTPEPTFTPEVTATPQATPLPEGACQQPPDDYAEVIVNGEILSQRTYWMLERAKELYPGPADLLRVTQGGFRQDVGASFGTHAGGGAVDISIRDPATNTYLFSETEAMVRALRLVGFAAWYREPGSLGQGSPPHIHAIAIGDRDLSSAAQMQLTGESGYFNGMDGLLPPNGPNPDPYGGPIICPWMNP